MSMYLRNTSSVVFRCRCCREVRVHDLAEGPRRFRWGPFFLLLVFSLGLGVVFAPVFYAKTLVTVCRRCGRVEDAE